MFFNFEMTPYIFFVLKIVLFIVAEPDESAKSIIYAALSHSFKRGQIPIVLQMFLIIYFLLIVYYCQITWAGQEGLFANHNVPF